MLQGLLDGDYDQFTEKYTFEDIKAHVLSPEEDLIQALNIYVKVALDPKYTYTVSRPGDIITNFYLIGNGARINVTCNEPKVIHVRNALAGPSIGGMHTPTFHNCVFVGNSDAAQNGELIVAYSNLLIHSCNFVDWNGTCVRSHTSLVLKGCLFVASTRCVRSTGDYQITVKHCTFKCCMICIATRCDFDILSNLFDECYSAILTSGTGRVIRNAITGSVVETVSKYKHLDLTTCLGGTTNMLCNVHISENRRKVVPKFEDNNFYRLKIFLGFRKGIYMFSNCSLHYCHLCLDMNSVEKLTLSSSYAPSLSVSKMIHIDFETRIVLKCECGISHAAHLPEFLDCTSDYLVDGRKRSCQSLDYSSEEE